MTIHAVELCSGVNLDAQAREILRERKYRRYRNERGGLQLGGTVQAGQDWEKALQQGKAFSSAGRNAQAATQFASFSLEPQTVNKTPFETVYLGGVIFGVEQQAEVICGNLAGVSNLAAILAVAPVNQYTNGPSATAGVRAGQPTTGLKTTPGFNGRAFDQTVAAATPVFLFNPFGWLYVSSNLATAPGGANFAIGLEPAVINVGLGCSFYWAELP